MKIAIIEDRKGRMDQYIGFDIKVYKEVTIITDKDFDNLLASLKSESTLALDQFNCIAIHKSPLSNDIRTRLQDYCKKLQKPLIFFSGSITSSFFKDNSYPLLHINSKDFYSSNLKIFIEESIKNKSINLLVLQFGSNWKLTLLLHLRNNIAVSQNIQAQLTNSTQPNHTARGIIKRIRDLQINSLIKSDLMDEKTVAFLAKDDTTSITTEQIEQVKNAINNLINVLL